MRVKLFILVVANHFQQAFVELKGNKLRSTLSLTGITIGIFCIISVFTVLDSLKQNIKNDIASLGNDVLYIGRWPWMDEGGVYKWWEYWQRPSMSINELKSVKQRVPEAQYSCLFLKINNHSTKFHDNELKGFGAYAVTAEFDKIQNIEINEGRYLSNSESEGGGNTVVIGSELKENLFGASIKALDKTISFLGKPYKVVGVLKKTGQNAAGIDFDNCIIISYFSVISAIDVMSNNLDPVLLVKSSSKISLSDLQYEVSGALRSTRRVKPDAPDNFSINQLSQVSDRMDMLFALINSVGGVIGGLSLIVGAFGIANIMFVSVKERTKIIGLKMALGARSNFIMIEFLLEAVILCFIGGLIGLILVLILILLTSSFSTFHFTLSISNIVFGIFTSVIVGLIAGYLPAKRAAKLDPAVAIRTI